MYKIRIGELKSATQRERSMETQTLQKILRRASAVRPLWKSVCSPHIVPSWGAADCTRSLQVPTGSSYIPGESPAKPSPSCTLVFPCLCWEICHHLRISSYLHLFYDTTYLTVLMSWLFFSFCPLFNKLPNEKVILERILWSCATLQALGGCGLGYRLLPTPWCSLLVSGQRPVWLSKDYREILSQQEFLFPFVGSPVQDWWWAALAHHSLVINLQKMIG